LDRLVLQVARHEPFVRHAIVAIGAINKAQMDPARSSKHQNEMAALHRRFAFHEYNKSLKELKDIIVSVGLSARQALLASLLSFCFENFLGNRPVAMYHAQAGHQILQDWVREHPHSLLHNVGLSSPAPDLVEDDLVHAFTQLDLQVLTVADARGREIHDSLSHGGHATIANMPKIFKDLEEARLYCALAMTRSYHFLLTAWDISRSAELATPFVTISSSHTFETNASKTLHGTPNIITDELLEQQRHYAAEVSAWQRAFYPLWIMLPRTTRNKELLIAIMLRINSIALEIMVAAVAFPDQMSYDRFLPSFKEVVDLVETHVMTIFGETPPVGGGFLLNLGISCPLGLVAMRCRDRAIRRKAITILESWFNEGPTDSVMVSKVGAFIMEIEEDGNESRIIPESSRAIPTLYCLDPVNNSILIQFCQQKGGSGGGPVWSEKKFDW
jgi:hypothetical protein